MFGVYTDPEKPNNLIECYKCTFLFQELIFLVTVSYSDDGSATLNFQGRKSGSIFTKEHIKKETFALLRTLTNFVSNLDTLPEEKYLTMKILYYDYTPEDYQPKFFKDASPGDFEVNFPHRFRGANNI